MTGVFLTALGVAIVRKAFVAPWLGWPSLVVAVFNVVAVWVGVTFSRYNGKGWNVVGWGASIGFLAVVLHVSISLLTRPREATKAAQSIAMT